MADIGKPRRVIEIVPLEEPAAVPDVEPEPVPAEPVPEEQPEEVPA